jgi:Ca2+-binding RTX toxin-like protein
VCDDRFDVCRDRDEHMATITLSNGIITGTPTSGADVVTALADTQSYVYFLRTGAGDDTLDLTNAYATTSHTVFTGAGTDTVTGGSGMFYDGSGNDTYRLGGTVFIFGGAGNDIYDGGRVQPDNLYGDYVSFEFKPSDTGVQQPHTQNLTINLAKTTIQNLGIFGRDTFVSIESVAGGNGNDTLLGTGAANILVGGGGNDSLHGLGGADLLTGGEGADRLNGGRNADAFNLLEQIAARDTIVIGAIADVGRYSRTSQAYDVVSYFDAGRARTDDRINLSAIDTSTVAGDQKFFWVGNEKFHTDAKWEVRVSILKPGSISTLASTLVQIDTDRDAVAEYSFIIEGVTGLQAYDFIL